MNWATGDGTTIGGGWNNTAEGAFPVIAGAEFNHIVQVDYATSGGGYNNPELKDEGHKQSSYSTIAGGRDNIAGWDGGCASLDRECATVGGGQENKATAGWSTIGGGYGNSAGTRGVE